MTQSPDTVQPLAVAPPTAGHPPRQGLFARLAERVGDRANPIVVRYVRQQLRSRAFIVVFSAMIGIAALASLGVGASASRGNEGAAAVELLGVLAVLWTFVAWVFEPLNAYRAVSGERDDQTWDLIRLTGLRPGKLLRGMLFASLIQNALFACAFAPFLVMAYLLRGIDILTIVFLLAFIPLCGMCASAGAIFLGCLGINRPARIALWTLCAVVCGLIWFVAMMGFANLDGAAFFWMFAGFSVDILPVVALILSFAAIWLLSTLILGATLVERNAANRSTAPRALAILLGLAWCGWAILTELPDLPSRSLLTGLAYGGAAMAVFAFVMGIFAVSEPWELTPRQARALTGMRAWQLPWMLGPGAARGRRAFIVYALLAVGVAYLGAVHSEGSDPVSAFKVAVAAASWAAIYLAIGDWIARSSRLKVKTPLGRRLIILALLGVGSFIALTALQLDPGADNPVGWLSPLPGLWLAGGESAREWDSVVALALPGVLAMTALAFQGLRPAAARARTRPAPDAGA